MDRTMVARANDNEVLRLVSATVRTSEQVVDIEPEQAAAPRDLAAPSSSIQ